MNALSRAVAIVLGLGTMTTTAALAAESAPSGNGADQASGGLQEITVTARRKAESLQDVPTSITALNNDDLKALQVTGFQSVGQKVPNVYIQKQGGSPQAPQMQIRGVSNGSLNLQVDSGIGLYVDGVYMGRPGASAFELGDLERVEVLRGPQGTLFGRNATGGAINLVTAGPTGELGAHIEAGIGNYAARRYKAVLNTAEKAGLSARLTIGHSEYEGDVKNIATRRTYNFPEPFGSQTTNARGGDSNSDNGMLALHYEGVDGLKVDYKFDFTNWKGTMNYRQLGNVDAGAAAPAALTVAHAYTQSFAYQDSLAVPLESTASNKVRGHSLVAEYELNESLSVKYIGGYRKYDLDAGLNQVYGAGEYIDAAGLVGGAVGGVWAPLVALRKEHQQQHSHELQLLGKSGPVDWIVGAFQFSETGTNNNPVMLFKSYGANNNISVAGFDYFVGQNVAVENNAKAVYAHANWRAGQFDLSGGLRRTKDDRSEFVIAAGLIGAILPGNQRFSYSGSNTDYDVSATYRVNDANNAYLKYSTGYVSGGTLFGGRYEPEKMRAYELGFKSKLLDNRLRLNAAVFKQDRKDVQIEGFTSIGYFMGRGRNVEAKGFELEAAYAASDDLLLDFSWGHTDVTSRLRTYQPKNTASVGAEYRIAEMGNGSEASLRLDAMWRDKVYRLVCPAGMDAVPATDNCSGTPNAALDAAARLDSTTLLNLQFALSEIKLGERARGRLSLSGRNLLDEKGIEFNFTLGGSTITNTFMRPRTYGVDFAVDF